MSPSFFASVASRWFVRRWWFLAAAVVGMAVVFALFALGSPRVAGTLAGPAIAVPWALLCACIWFHPERGNLQPGSKLVGRLPAAVQSGVRWYAALFLAFFFVFAVIVWPALSLAWF